MKIVIVGREIDLRAAVLDLPDHAVEQFSVLVCGRDRAAEIERQIGIAEIVHPGLEIADRLCRRRLADGVDDAARAGAAIQHGRGTAQHLDTGEVERLQLPARIGRVEQLQPVEEQADIVRLEAADQEPVVARVGAECSGDNARRVAQNLVELAGFLVADLFAADHRERLRRLHDRRIGLGARHRAAGDVTLDRAARILDDGRRCLAFRLGPSRRGRALRRRAPAASFVVAAVRFSGEVTTTDGSDCDAEPELDCANIACGHNTNTDAVADAATLNTSRDFKASPQPASTCRAFRKLGSATPVGRITRGTSIPLMERFLEQLLENFEK